MGKFKIGDRVFDTASSNKDCAVVKDVNGSRITIEWEAMDGLTGEWSDTDFELVPTFTISTDKFYRTRNGMVTGRLAKGDTGFEAVVDGKVRIYDAAGGHVHGDADLDIVEAWVPRVGERVVEAAPKQFDFPRHWFDYWQQEEGSLVDDSFVVTKVNGIHVKYSNRVDGRGPQATIECFEPLPVAAPQPAAVLQIEAGKFYRTRDGRKVGPMRDDWSMESVHHYHVTEGILTGNLWSATGGGYLGQERDTDLIAEWVDEPVAVAAPAVAEASNDNKPKFKVGDRVFARYGDLCGNGTVTHVDTDDDDMPYRVDFGAEGSFWCYNEGVTSPLPEAENDNVPVAEQPAGLIKTRNGYGFEIARFGDYVWVDTGKKAPETFRASSVSAA